MTLQTYYNFAQPVKESYLNKSLGILPDILSKPRTTPLPYHGFNGLDVVLIAFTVRGPVYWFFFISHQVRSWFFEKPIFDLSGLSDSCRKFKSDRCWHSAIEYFSCRIFSIKTSLQLALLAVNRVFCQNILYHFLPGFWATHKHRYLCSRFP